MSPFVRAMCIVATLIFAIGIGISGCGQSAPAAPSPTTSAAPTATAPTTSAPKTEPTAAATVPAKPAAATPASSGISITDLIAKVEAATEYSVKFDIATPGATVSGKMYVKGMKIRQETNVAGNDTVMLLDLSNKVAYMLLVAQKTAMKLDFSQAAAQVENPRDQVSALPSDAKLIGTESVDGKSAVVYEVPNPQGSSRIWIWLDRGLPLKVEVTTSEGKVVMTFSDYQFGSQPDSLFELPADVKVMELPAGVPGAPGGVPAPKP